MALGKIDPKKLWQGLKKYRYAALESDAKPELVKPNMFFRQAHTHGAARYLSLIWVRL